MNREARRKHLQINSTIFRDSPKTLLREERRGYGAMGLSAKYWYQMADGSIVLHCWSIRGERLQVVANLPTAVSEGYEVLTREGPCLLL